MMNQRLKKKRRADTEDEEEEESEEEEMGDEEVQEEEDDKMVEEDETIPASKQNSKRKVSFNIINFSLPAFDISHLQIGANNTHCSESHRQ